MYRNEQYVVRSVLSRYIQQKPTSTTTPTSLSLYLSLSSSFILSFPSHSSSPKFPHQGINNCPYNQHRTTWVAAVKNGPMGRITFAYKSKFLFGLYPDKTTIFQCLTRQLSFNVWQDKYLSMFDNNRNNGIINIIPKNCIS